MSTPVVLITGAAGGLGRAIAKRFAQSHWRIAATDVDKEGLHALNAQVPLDASGVADLRSADNCHTLMSKILARTGRLDALVNAAGVWREGPVENFTEEDFDLVLGVNLKASFDMCQAAIPYLKENQGSIVNISSDSGRQAYRGSAAYCASKAALTMLSKTLALELAEQGVRVNAVSPADIATPMLDYQAERYGMGNPDGYKRALLKDYPQGKETVRILKNINLQVEEGDYLAIMGPSGSGKTTLMNLLGCLDVPTSGEYLLAGEDVTQANENHLAEIRNRLLGFVFQSFYLLPKLSAVDNVALPLLYAGVNKKERRERAIEALQMMGLGQRLNFRPNQLSGGQCQRVAIARAIVGRPKLLLADEPTGALDSAAGNQIMDIFDALNDTGSTIIMITHEQEIAERAKRINYIRDGILSDGRRDGESLA